MIQSVFVNELEEDKLNEIIQCKAKVTPNIMVTDSGSSSVISNNDD